MRKWLAFGAVAMALAGGSAWYFGWWQRSARAVPDLSKEPDWVKSGPVDIKDDGNAEPADTIEPLVVESNLPAPVLPTSLPELEAPPVYWTPDAKQAPRPDAEPGKALRMPNLEEWGLLAWSLHPLARILEAAAPSQWKRFEMPKAGEPAEEAENKEGMPPAEPPLPLQVPDYHHQYPSCPYTGGHCPIPYPYYPRR